MDSAANATYTETHTGMFEREIDMPQAENTIVHPRVLTIPRNSNDDEDEAHKLTTNPPSDNPPDTVDSSLIPVAASNESCSDGYEDSRSISPFQIIIVIAIAIIAAKCVFR